MADKKDTHKEFGTCFENMPFAERMRKVMGRQGVGSLCAEMMKKINEQREAGCSFDCAEMIRKMMKDYSKVQKDREQSKEEV
jgi:DNA-binding ferritin-like protein